MIPLGKREVFFFLATPELGISDDQIEMFWRTSTDSLNDECSEGGGGQGRPLGLPDDGGPGWLEPPLRRWL